MTAWFTVTHRSNQYHYQPVVLEISNKVNGHDCSITKGKACVLVKTIGAWFSVAAAVGSLWMLPQWFRLWPAAVCPACWPTAAWPRPLSSSGVCSEPPAIAATPACAGQNTPGDTPTLPDHSIPVTKQRTRPTPAVRLWLSSMSKVYERLLRVTLRLSLYCADKMKS